MEFGVLGMTEEAERVYRALVGHPRSSSADLAELCGMPPTSVGRLLSALVDDGLATRTAGRPPRHTANAPDVAVSTLIQQREQQLHEARVEVQRLMTAHREATRISHPDLAVELLTSRDEVSAAVQRLTAHARRELRAFDCPPYVDRPGSNLDEQFERQRRGVAHRVIYDRQAVAWPGRLHQDIVPSIRAGEQARIRTELPLKLLIIDSGAAVVPFSLAPGGQTAAYLVHDSPLLVALESLFEAHWERAVPLVAPGSEPGTATGPTTDGASGAPDEETRTLLELLASGLTDAAITRALGWSERTTQRRIQRLMGRLDATTRFQAGLAAARRGWL
ncbi:winged helix-turn-helix transcriptional regulator [Peterkaempfera sp. SMS 1(5)a]|uniref:winged helix-turn-helix transcriptional regulator n=1 Tax=Peterkaempfera podocarpi TaxID=3232308 RepID=UPI00366F4C3F